jgi:hypothetical protein
MNSGYLGSFIIHGVLLAIGLSAASLAMTDTNHEPPDTDGTVILDTGPSTGESGGGGGPTSTAVTPGKPVAWTPVKVIKSEELIQQWIRNRTPTTAPEPVNPVSTPSVRPVRPTPAPTSGPSPQVPTRTGAPTGDRRPLVAPTVDVGGPGPGTGDVGPGGPGPGVSGPGSGNTAGFTASVRAGFSGAFRPLFREQGADIVSDKDSGEVKLRVSPAGNVTFAGWITRPSEPLLEKIVQRSIEAMPPVPPPPDGVEVLVRIKFTGSVE